MSEITKHTIGTRNGPRPLLEWVSEHKYRNYANFNVEAQLEVAKKIAANEDLASRKLCLDLLNEATRLQCVVEEMHKEFDTLHAALSKIVGNEQKP